jgi:hypothetical protein
MKFYAVEPEVAGSWGENIKVDHSAEILRVEHLHYNFDGWLGDELLTTHPCFICTERVALALKEDRFSGFELSDVEITTSEQFNELYPSKTLPNFFWLKIIGTPKQDDFGTLQDILVVSEGALKCLKSFTLLHAEISDL